MIGTSSVGSSGSQVNYIYNPGFEIGLTDWSQVAPGTIALNSNQQYAYHGLKSMDLTTTASNGGATTSTFTGTVAAGTYTVSFYVYPLTAMNASAFTITLNDGSNHTCSPTAQVLSTSGFTRVACTPSATTNNLTSLTIAQNDGTARANIYIDATQLQPGSSATPYDIGTIQLRGVISNPTTFQSVSNSTTAFQIQNAAGTSNLFVADTLDGNIGIGTSSTPGALLSVGGTTGSFQVNSSGNVTAYSSLTFNAGSTTTIQQASGQSLTVGLAWYSDLSATSRR
jgi:hypothetical protein